MFAGRPLISCFVSRKQECGHGRGPHYLGRTLPPGVLEHETAEHTGEADNVRTAGERHA